MVKGNLGYRHRGDIKMAHYGVGSILIICQTTAESLTLSAFESDPFIILFVENMF